MLCRKRLLHPRKLLGKVVVLYALCLVGCQSIKVHEYAPNPALQPNLDDIPKIEAPKLTLKDNLPKPPESGRAFFGVRAKQCDVPMLGKGTYVIGYFDYEGKSPARDAGLVVRDKIVEVNGRTNVTADDFTDYIPKVARNASYEIKIHRLTQLSGKYQTQIIIKSINSFGLPEKCVIGGKVSKCLIPTGVSDCDKLIENFNHFIAN